MIAEPNRHIESQTLRELLDDGLSAEQADRVESHLDSCETCRHELEQIAGQPPWWDETVGVLSQSTLTPVDASRPSDDRSGPVAGPSGETRWKLDPSLDWIRPLLERSAEGGLGRIEQYPVDELIGQGGMGVVLRGIDPELNRPVAIKILSPHLAGMGAARSRFMREAQAAAAIVHPSIVPIYSIATAARLPYIVMPCIAGGNLQQRIDREGPLPLTEVLRIGLQIAEGLEAAHGQGVIHRDIKPANILIEEGNGRVLISDFGLARALDDATLTMSGMIAGTPQYMSPEQARGEAVDPRSDLFSLGSLMYALAIGRPPFRAETPLAVLRKISESSPKPIQRINEQMPAWLDRVVGRLMTIDPAERIASAGEAVEMLRQSLTHARNPSTHPLPSSIGRERQWLRQLPSRRWLPAAVLAPALFGAVMFAVPQWAPNRPDDSAGADPGKQADAASAIPPSPAIDLPLSLPTSLPTSLPVDESALSWHAEPVYRELAAVNQEIDAMADALFETTVSHHGASSNLFPQDSDLGE